MEKIKKTHDAKKGGLFVGKSHAKGGIPAIVVDTGQQIEVEGGEAIINKEATKKYWKELSKINQSAGNGVPIPPPTEFSKEVDRYKGGGKITLSAIRQGTEVEMEHAKTIEAYKKQGVSIKSVAQKIAKDHLRENPNYYKILKKIKLAKGGEIICRTCSNSWFTQTKDVGQHIYKCNQCESDNTKHYRKGGNTDPCWDGYTMFGMKTKSGQKVPNCIPTKTALSSGGKLSISEKEEETYKQWKTLVNMSKSELQEFYNSKEGKKAGLSSSEASKLGIDNGRASARWIIKMKDIPFVSWSPTMWKWAKKQISFIKRMSGNKGSLYDENGSKTRKHTSLLIWGHNPEKFNLGGQTQAQKEKVSIVMHEFKQGELKTPSGQKVTDRKQAIAIALSEAGVSKYAKGNKVPSKNKGGDCYYVAGNIAMEQKLPIFMRERKIEFIGTPYLVHAEVSGQGAISGLRYGHAWVEDDLNVYDFSNGREIVFPKPIYYLLGNVKQQPPKYYKYTFKEAIDKMLETGHYGSWELKTESGL